MKAKQEVMSMYTVSPNPRGDVVGWSYDDPSVLERGEREYTRACLEYRRYKRVLEALADGWVLLGPPQKSGDLWDWWLVRDLEDDD